MTVWTHAHTDCLCESLNASQMPIPCEQMAHDIPHPASITSACSKTLHSIDHGAQSMTCHVGLGLVVKACKQLRCGVWMRLY